MKPTIQVFYVTAFHQGTRVDVGKFFDRKHAEVHAMKMRPLEKPEVDERTEDLDAQHAEHCKALGKITVMFVPKPGVTDLPTVEVDVDDEEFKDTSK